MGNPALLHPTEQTLSDFSLGKLDGGTAELINNHLKECPDCRHSPGFCR
jgi:Putative zinc-finger